MADTITTAQELVVTAKLQRGEETATRSFTFPVVISDLEGVRSLASDLETSLTGGYSTVFQPTSWRDEDIAEDEFTIIEATSEIVNKVVMKLDTSGGGGGGEYFIGSTNYSDANPTVTSATVTVDADSRQQPVIALARWIQTGDDKQSVQTAYSDWTVTAETVGSCYLSGESDDTYTPETGYKLEMYYLGEEPTEPATFSATVTAADSNSFVVTATWTPS